jgi:branched-chain amino acid transport system ATP-binding protein
MASDLADQYFILDDGQTVNAGRMADLVDDAALISKYLGVA